MDGGLGQLTLRRRVYAAATLELWHATGPDGADVALTLLEPGSAHDPERAERVARAAESGARLHGPHLVPATGHGVLDDRLGLTRGWVTGDPLDHPRFRGGMHPAFAVGVVEQLVGALDSAWPDVGVHGDLRSRHVVVTTAHPPQVVLVGFEWARLAPSGPAPGPDGRHLAPELFDGAAASPSGDVYSVAFLLHGMLSGVPPFADGRVPADGVREVPSVGGPLCGPWDELLQRALAVEPGERPATGAELAEQARKALEAWRRDATGPGTLPPPAAAPGPGRPDADGPGPGSTDPVTATGADPAPDQDSGTGPDTRDTADDSAGDPDAGTGSDPRAGTDTGREDDATDTRATDDRATDGEADAPTDDPAPDAAPDPATVRDGDRFARRPGSPRTRRPRWGSPRRPASRLVYAALAAAAAVLSVAGVAFALSGTTAAPPDGGVAVGGDPVAVATSPDARTVVVSDASGSVAVVDLAARAVTARIPVGVAPRGIAVERYGRLAFVANSGSDSVSVIDIGSRAVVATVPTGEAPVAVTVRADGARAYVANEQSADITVIDTSTLAVVGTIDVAMLPWKTLEGIAVSRDGGRAVVTLDSGWGDDTVQVVDLATGRVTGDVVVGHSPAGVALSPDGRRAWVADSGAGTVSVADLDIGARTRTIPVGGTPTAVHLGRDGLAYVPGAGDGVAALDVTASERVADPAPGVDAVAMSIAVRGRALHLVGDDGVLTTVDLP